MTLDHRAGLLDSEDEPTLLSRRGLLRRSVYGVTGIGLASLLAACGDDDEDDPEDTENGEETSEDAETDGPTGIEDVDEQPEPQDITGEGAEDDEED